MTNGTPYTSSWIRCPVYGRCFKFLEPLGELINLGLIALFDLLDLAVQVDFIDIAG